MVRSGPPGALHFFFVFCFAHSGWNDDDPNWRHPDGHVTDPSADCSGFQLSLLGMQMPSLALVGGSGRGWNVGKCECSVRIKCGKEFYTSGLELFFFFFLSKVPREWEDLLRVLVGLRILETQ